MKRHIPGLQQCSPNPDSTLEGLFLVRVERAFYRWHAQKPFFTLRFAVIEPTEYVGQSITGRIYCSPKALWKLNWFLQGLWLRSGSFGSRRGGRTSTPRLTRDRARLPHLLQRPLLPQPRIICPCK